MSGTAVLIAALSGRALAQSARRAGFLPLVVDCFADLDMRQAAHAWRTLPAAMTHGFHAKTLLGALGDLTRTSATPPLGLVLGAGFEDQPRLVERLEDTYRLLGCPASAIRATKDPTIFFPLIASRGITHPETRLAPPPSAEGWLSKRIGASGGGHIQHVRKGKSVGGRRYYQRMAAGVPLSMLGIVGPRGSAFAFTRQWPSPTPVHPFRYGGAVGDVTLEAELEARLVEIGVELSREFGLAGLVSFDFLERDGEVSLLEINPRAGASLDVLDDETGSLFAAHLAACLGEDAIGPLSRTWTPRPRAAAYLYADEGPLTIPVRDWPAWSADRPAAGTAIARGRPAATVIAEGKNATDAAATVHRLLGELGNMLYRPQKNIGKETPQ